MNFSEKFPKILPEAPINTEEALKLFDSLEPIDLDFAIGKWEGHPFHTNHPMDGWLEALNWYGKEFVSLEEVHPLLFLDNRGKIFKIAPKQKAMNLAFRFPPIGNRAIQFLFNMINVLLKTEKSQARIRMVEYRHKISATMIYDNLPIHDVFRKIDENTLLGLMDFKGMERPFFFILKRAKVVSLQ
jgi:DNA modification methylase